MTDSRALLPAGLRDVLPPDAAHEAAIVAELLAACAAQGYDRIDPPLVEFEEGLLTGPGAALATATFRLMDPVSQHMMAVRPDITGQIARIAASRLGAAPRPLRLSYAGPVLRVTGDQLRPERQFVQVGSEIIGSLAPAADAEVILLAVEALGRAGVRHLSVDLTVPTLVPSIARAFEVPAEAQSALRAALDRKDAAAVAAIAGPAARLADTLMAASGPAARAVSVLGGLDLPAEAEGDRRRLTEVVALLRRMRPELTLTVDLVEHRGFEYQTGLSFTLFARGVRGELGRGGRYRAGAAGGGLEAKNGEEGGEPATGFSLFMDSVLRAVPGAPPPSRRLFVPFEAAARAAALRAEGWTTIAGLEPAADPRAEARRLGCTHLWDGQAPSALSA